MQSFIDINSAEAVRHALGAVSGELSVDLTLVDGGVLLAKKGQDDTETGLTNLEGALMAAWIWEWLYMRTIFH
jgi:sulfur relay (sulfurtransferase) DsrF/TusC family protein